VVLGTVLEGEPKLVAMVTQDVIAKGISAGDIIKGITGGKGGGRPNMAQGGISDANGLDKALDMVVELVAQKLGGTNGK
jgi:alanyl-tRNA synthetase